MSRQRTIVSIGQAHLAEWPDRTEPAGFALRVAMSAVQLGQKGIAISRIGQDDTAEELTSHLVECKVDTSHLQTDPDLATGRLIIQTVGGQTKKTEISPAAHDNLQWDYDLDDVAQVADAVVFGAKTLLAGQAWTVVHRFVTAAQTALRMVDLTEVPAEQLDRSNVTTALELSEVAFVNDAMLGMLNPGITIDSVESWSAAAQNTLKHNELLLIAGLGDADQLQIQSADEFHTAPGGSESELEDEHEMLVTSLVYGILQGWTAEKLIEFSRHAVAHQSRQPGASIPVE